MHSSIFVLDGSYEYDESDVFELLHENIPCDYVREVPKGSNEYNSQLGDLDNYYKNSCTNGNIFLNSDKNRDAYMEQKYERIEDFIDKGQKYFNENLDKLKALIDDKKDFYILNEGELYTLDSFIAEKDNLGVYEITQIFDYHY